MLALILAAALLPSPCANPSIIHAGIQSIATNGALKHITVWITVENLGVARQPGSLLQSLDVLQDGEKVGKIGLQPLRPKQSQKVTYSFDRSAEADSGTTDLTFTLDLNGRSGHNVDCGAGKHTITISV